MKIMFRELYWFAASENGKTREREVEVMIEKGTAEEVVLD